MGVALQYVSKIDISGRLKMHRFFKSQLRRIATAALCMALLAAFAPHPARAVSTLSGTLSVDNAFFLYLSTDDTQRGTLIASGTDWTTPISFSTQVLTRGTNYLHLETFNQGGPYGFLGTFKLWSSSAQTTAAIGGQFGTGTNTLQTDTTNWKTVFGANFTNGYTPTAQAWKTTTTTAVTTTTGGTAPYTNGVSPWVAFSSIDSTAKWIGDASTLYTQNNGNFSVYYSASFVPEPAGVAVFGAALAAGMWLRRRKR